MLAATGLLCVVGYYHAERPTPEPAPIADVPPQQEEAAPDVPFLIKAKVRLIWEQHEKLIATTSKGDIDPARTRIRIAVEDIRERLGRDGIRDRFEIERILTAAAAQAGFDGAQTDSILALFREHAS